MPVDQEQFAGILVHGQAVVRLKRLLDRRRIAEVDRVPDRERVACSGEHRALIVGSPGLVVEGSHRLPSKLLVKDAWLRLEFSFGEDGRFEEADSWVFPFDIARR